MSETPVRTWTVVAAVSMGMLMSMMDQSIVNIVLPTLTRAFQSEFSVVQWIVLQRALVNAFVDLLICDCVAISTARAAHVLASSRLHRAYRGANFRARRSGWSHYVARALRIRART